MNWKLSGKSTILIGCLFFLIGLAVYWNSLDNPFCYLDDHEYVVNNQNIREIGNIPEFFIKPRLSTRTPQYAGHYRPLVTTSYAVDYAISGLNPVGYHLTSLFFHIGSAILIFLMMQTLLEEKRGQSSFQHGFLASVAAGLIFLVHPFNSEAVNYITARSSVMNGFFFMLAFYCWMRYRNQGQGFFYLSSLFAFVLSMLSKEVAITLPVLLWLYDLFFFNGNIITPSNRRPLLARVLNWRNYLYYLPFVFIVVVPYLVIRISHFGRIFPGFRRDLVTQIFTGLPLLVRHLFMFILPKGLSVFHDVEIYRKATATVILAGLLLLLYIATAVFLARVKHIQWRVVSFFMFWFLIVLLPMIIIPLNAIFRESRGYLAIMSFAFFVGAIFFELGKRGLTKISIGVIMVLFVLYSAATIHRNIVWGDEVLLWKEATERAPYAGITYAGLTAAYIKKGEIQQAIDAAKKGLSKVPPNYYLLVNLGDGLEILGKKDQALMVYKKALAINSRQPVLWNSIALLLRQKGDLNNSEYYLREGLKIGKDYPPLHYNLGIVLNEKGDSPEAIKSFQEAFLLYPSYVEARFDLARALEKQGRFEEAKEQYAEIVKIDADSLAPESLVYGQDKEKIELIIKEARERNEGITRGF